MREINEEEINKGVTNILAFVFISLFLIVLVYIIIGIVNFNSIYHDKQIGCNYDCEQGDVSFCNGITDDKQGFKECIHSHCNCMG